MTKPKKRRALRPRPANGAAYLGKDEEYALIAKAQAGDEAAMTTLLRRHAGFVYSVAARFRGRGLENEDLVQAGAHGLSIAIRRFDATRDVRLTTYAKWWIVAEINRTVAEGGKLIHIPQGVLEEMAAIEREIRRQVAKTGTRPDDRVLLKRLGIGKEHLANAKDAQALKSLLSLDAPARQDETATFVDLLRDEAEDAEEILLAQEARVRLSALIAATLTPIEAAVLTCRFVDELTLEDTAERVAPLMRRKRVVTRERIRQIEERMLDKLRDHLTGQGSA